MTGFLERIFPRPPETPVVPPGMYHRIVADPTTVPYRLHLRVDADGRSLLIVNASTVLHLNPTATAIAWHMVRGTLADEAAAWTAQRFRVSRSRALRDGRLIRDQIEALAEGDDHDPVMVMGMERNDPFSLRPAAPYRLDLALTYRMGDGDTQDPAARRRVDRELETREWIAILDQAWAAGIPHIVFSGGEPTARPDLLDLIRHAEGLGQVTGIVTYAARLAQGNRIDDLAQAGVDHLLAVIDPTDSSSLVGLQRAVDSDVFCVGHFVLTAEAKIESDLRAVRAVGLTHISVTTPPGPGSGDRLARAEQAIADLGLTLVWDLPAPFSLVNPIRLEVGEDLGRRAWLYVEPDGDVLPSQGAEVVLGNLTRESIAEIWHRDAEALHAGAG